MKYKKIINIHNKRCYFKNCIYDLLGDVSIKEVDPEKSQNKS